MKPEPNHTEQHQGLTASELNVAQSGGLDPNMITGHCSDPATRGDVAYASLLQAGLTTLEAAKRLEVSEAHIHQRLHDGTMLAFRDGQLWKLPLFQFTEEGELRGWEEIVLRLPRDMSPVAMEQWLLLPNSDLVTGEDETPMSPRAWLQEGHPIQAVAWLADGMS